MTTTGQTTTGSGTTLMGILDPCALRCCGVERKLHFTVGWDLSSSVLKGHAAAQHKHVQLLTS